MVFAFLRWVRLALLAALVCGLVGQSDARGMPVRQPVQAPAVRLVADSGSAPSYQSDNPDDYVQVRDGKFVLAGKPFVIKGTNYFGSWLHNDTDIQADGVERWNPWAFYHDWDGQKVDADFRFIRSHLNASVVRVATPSVLNFESLIKFNGYQPWYNPDGTIAERYKSELIELADIAFENGIRIQFCLLWYLGQEILKDRDAFRPGGRMDRFYSNQVRSIAMALRDHPGVIGYSVGNEVLVNWPINGTHTSWYERLAVGFIQRHLQDLRAEAPRQLLTVDEVAAPQSHEWYTPGPEFALIPDVDNGRPVRLADDVDYFSPHFYPETYTTEEAVGRGREEINDAQRQLRLYMQTASADGKPVSVGEFGLKVTPSTLPREQYSRVRDFLFQGFLAEGERLGLQGLLAWAALPGLVLRPAHYWLLESKINPYSPVELDLEDGTGQRLRRIVFYEPSFELFTWREGDSAPRPTAAARAIANAWSQTPLPSRASSDIIR